MTFTARDVRRGMDVFSSDGILLGTVVHISKRHETVGPPPTSPAAPPNSPFSGETLGPMPTTAVGNRGPDRQQAAARHATTARDEELSASAEIMVVRTLVALNWQMLWPRVRRYPISLVLNISHERIVLAVTEAELEVS